jgi:hypothetical protein
MTFMLPSGRWQYLQGPMGLSATSDDWCRKSDFVIKRNENARKIVDDILCWGATMQELMTKLDTILLRCKAIGIPPAASSPSLGMDGEADSSPPRSMAARTPLPTTIVETPDNPLANNATNALFISPHLGNWDPIRDGSKVTQEDTDRRRQEDIDCMLKRQREQNKRDMQDIPGFVARKERSYAKLYARERILVRQAEQRQRRIFKDLQEQGNKQKLRRPFDPLSYKPLPMGLSFKDDWMTEDWMRGSDTWNKKHIPNWN